MTRQLELFTQRLYNNRVKATSTELQQLYNYCLSRIQYEISIIYDQMLANDSEITTTKLYAYGRYNSLQQAFARELQHLAEQEIAIDNAMLERVYVDTFNKTSSDINNLISFAVINESFAAEVIAQTRIADKHFSERIWDNISRLHQHINKALVDTVLLGKSKDIAVKTIKERFNTAFYCADRIVRTETMSTINEAQKDSYVKNGYTNYRWLTHVDDRTCKECVKKNNKEYRFEEWSKGNNAPPLHPNCRCTIVPIIN